MGNSCLKKIHTDSGIWVVTTFGVSLFDSLVVTDDDQRDFYVPAASRHLAGLPSSG